jgi:hypothetical protein
MNELCVEDLDFTIAPAGVSDSVGALPCGVVFVVIVLWPTSAE